jgi:glycosyltransferase involved in cell wall biosynthesis
LREALAIGCPIIGGDTETVREFITHGENGVLTPFLEPKSLARSALGLLEDKKLARTLQENARAYAQRRLAMSDYMAAYCTLIARLTGENPGLSATTPAGKSPRRNAAPRATRSRTLADAAD